MKTYLKCLAILVLIALSVKQFVWKTESLPALLWVELLHHPQVEGQAEKIRKHLY